MIAQCWSTYMHGQCQLTAKCFQELLSREPRNDTARRGMRQEALNTCTNFLPQLPLSHRDLEGSAESSQSGHRRSRRSLVPQKPRADLVILIPRICRRGTPHRGSKKATSCHRRPPSFATCCLRGDVPPRFRRYRGCSAKATWR